MDGKYCMYLRKSRADIEAEERGEGETLKRHEKILLDLARKMNIFIGEDAIYREIVSGETIAARPVMQKLLSDVGAGKWKGIFVVEVERLARGETIDQGLVAQTFKYSNTKIITPLKTYNPNDEFDEEYFEFGLYMARREYKTINRRLQRGRTLSAKEGKYVGNTPPYGYSRVKLKGQKGYTLEPKPDEARIVKLIYKWYTNGELQEDGTYERLGVSLIAKKLNEMRVLPRKGKDWTTSTIRGILSNPVYIGKIRWKARAQKKKMVNGEMIIERPRSKDPLVFDGLHPAIIDYDTYKLAQKYLAENPSLPVPTRYIVKNPLAGLIVCGMCGRKMNRRPYQKASPSLMCIGPTCSNVSSPLHLVEEKLLQALRKWLMDYKIEIKIQENKKICFDTEIIKQSIKDIEKELETLNKQLNSLHDLVEQGVYSTDTFIKRSQNIESKINTAKASKDELETKLKNIFSVEEKKKSIIPRWEKVLNIYNKLESAKDKNELLKEILDKVIYTKEEGGRWSGKVDDFELVINPKLPQDH